MSAITREQMDALVDGHYRAEEAADLDAIVAGFGPGAEHDVAGRRGGELHGGEKIAGYSAVCSPRCASIASSPYGAGTATTTSPTSGPARHRRRARVRHRGAGARGARAPPARVRLRRRPDHA